MTPFTQPKQPAVIVRSQIKTHQHILLTKFKPISTFPVHDLYVGGAKYGANRLGFNSQMS